MKTNIFLLLFGLIIVASCKIKPQKTDVTTKPFTSTHVFDATFEGVTFQTCHGRTARCPETCGDSGNMANFKVDAYETFVVNGESGTEKLNDFHVLISDFHKKDLQKPYVSVVKSLKKGDKVKVHVDFVYNTTKNIVEPVVDIISITKL